MTMRVIGLVLILLGAATAAGAQDRHAVTGLVVDVQPESRTFVASIDAIPGFMAAMVMPFRVRDAAELHGLTRGATVSFSVVVSSTESWAEGVTIRRVENLEQDPLAARRLALIQELTTGRAARRVPAGEHVPDFRLIDQRARDVSLSDFAGKVVAINFTYTTCVLPDFCLRMVNHFGALQRRFGDALGRDLVFLTITFDPARDTPDVLDRYAAQWQANPDTWHFLTGAVGDVREVLDLFGMSAFANDGLMDHALRTAIVGRDGRLVTTLEGNRFSTTQLGDLLASELAR
jgi:protein SCO1/2